MTNIHPNNIVRYTHCKMCCNELPAGQSMREYARLNVGWTQRGLQFWCERHDTNVLEIDFKGNKVDYADPVDTLGQDFRKALLAARQSL